VKFHLGGYAADRRYDPSLASRGNSEYDFAQALALVDIDHLERLLVETEREIAAHWSQVQAVAAALLEREMAECDGASRDHHQGALN
jgi:hypothetical protein